MNGNALALNVPAHIKKHIERTGELKLRKGVEYKAEVNFHLTTVYAGDDEVFGSSFQKLYNESKTKLNKIPATFDDFVSAFVYMYSAEKVGIEPRRAIEDDVKRKLMDSKDAERLKKILPLIK